MSLKQLSLVLVLILGITLPVAVRCQSTPEEALLAKSSLVEISRILRETGKHILIDTTDELRRQANEKFKRTLIAVLKRSDSYNFKFDSVENFSRIAPEDNSFRLFTWQLPKVDESEHLFFGFIQQKDGDITLYELQDKTSSLSNAQNMKLSPDNWLGALYYKITTRKHDGKKYYTLLGWKGNNKKTTKKVVDVLVFNKDIPVFGQPIFKEDKITKHRVIMEYSASIYAMLRYETDKELLKTAVPLQSFLVNKGEQKDAMKDNKKKKEKNKGEKVIEYKKIKEGMIVMDHLSPATRQLEGAYEFYGPDFTYDGYYFEKGKWTRYSDLDIRSEKLPVEPPKPRPAAASKRVNPNN